VNGCNIPGGAYSFSPNTTFFITVDSYATGYHCFRGQDCNSGAFSYRADEIPANYFNVITSKASGFTCYRISPDDPCDATLGAYSFSPNTLFFNTVSETRGEKTCYRGAGCNTDAKAESSEWSTQYFVNVYSVATGDTCYRATACNGANGAYSASPNTAFFSVNSQQYATPGVIDITCWRATGCSSEATTESSTTYFLKNVSYGSGRTCYRATACNTGNGAYSHGSGTPSTTYFNTTSTQPPLTGITCDYATGCRYMADGDARLCLFDKTTTDTKKIPTGSNITCTNSSDCSAASKNIPTGYFTTSSVNNGAATCVYATGAASGYHIADSARSSDYFNYDQKSTDAYYSSGCQTKWSYKASSCKHTTDEGPHCLFKVSGSSADGVGPCYHSTDCVWEETPHTTYFVTATANVGGITCGYATKTTSNYCDVNPSTIDTTFFATSGTSTYATNKGTSGCGLMYATRITGCASGSTTEEPSKHFAYGEQNAPITCSDVTKCYHPTGCASGYRSGGTSGYTVSSSDSGYITIDQGYNSTLGYYCGKTSCTYEDPGCDTTYFTPSYTSPYYGTPGCFMSVSAKGGCYQESSTMNTGDGYYFNWGSEKSCSYGNNKTKTVYKAESCYLSTSGCGSEYFKNTSWTSLNCNGTCPKSAEAAGGCYQESKIGYSHHQWDSGKSCAGKTVYKATGCTLSCDDPEDFDTTEEKLSGCRICYVSATPKTGKCYSKTGTEKTDIYSWDLKTCVGESVYKASCKSGNHTTAASGNVTGSDGKSYAHSDVFTELKDTDCGTCYYSATCANGWSSSYSGSESDFIKVNSRSYAAGYSTCYKKKGCPDGYFEDKPGAAFKYTSQTVGDKTCYQYSECNTGYSLADTKWNEFEYHGNYCYEKIKIPEDIQFIFHLECSKMFETGCYYRGTYQVHEGGSLSNLPRFSKIEYAPTRVSISGTIDGAVHNYQYISCTGSIMDDKPFCGDASYGFTVERPGSENPTLESCTINGVTGGGSIGYTWTRTRADGTTESETKTVTVKNNYCVTKGQGGGTIIPIEP